VRTDQYAPESGNERRRVGLFCLNCPEETLRIDLDMPMGWGTSFYNALEIEKISRSKRPLRIIDPRKLGLVLATTLDYAQKDLGSVLESPRGKDWDVRQIEWKGTSAIRVSFQRPNRSKLHYVVVPDWGHAVVSMESIASTHDLQTHREGLHLEPAQKFPRESARTVISADYQKYDGKGVKTIWFPSLVTYTLEYDGEPVRTESANVEILSLGEPLDEDLFQLAGMDLSIPTPISRATSAGQERLIWDGVTPEPDQRSPYYGPNHGKAGPPSIKLTIPDHGTSRRWLWLLLTINGALFLTITIFLLIRQVR